MSRSNRQIRPLVTLGCAASLATITSLAAAMPMAPLPVDGDEGVGDFVWNDIDMDGLWDEGEPGLQGVGVNLFLTSGNQQIGGETTDASGFYFFYNGESSGNLDPFNFYSGSDMYIEFVLPDGFVFSPQDVGGDDTIDSDADPVTGLTATFSYPNNEFISSIDAGMYREASDVPAPATLPLIGIGLAALGWLRGLRRRR